MFLATTTMWCLEKDYKISNNYYLFYTLTVNITCNYFSMYSNLNIDCIFYFKFRSFCTCLLRLMDMQHFDASNHSVQFQRRPPIGLHRAS
ncbi:hypothetical protein ANTQUA_LOCUS8060 [Anthophora quadrimaculata]